MKITETESKICKMCEQKFPSSKLRIIHVQQEHGLSFEEYILKVYYNNEYPKCKCGCGTILSFKSNKLGPFFSDYTTNHFPRKLHTKKTIELITKNTKNAIKKKYGVENPWQTKKVKEKAKQTKLKKYGDKNYNNPEKNKQTQHTQFYKKLFSSNRLKELVVPLFSIEEYDGVKNLQ